MELRIKEEREGVFTVDTKYGDLIGTATPGQWHKTWHRLNALEGSTSSNTRMARAIIEAIEEYRYERPRVELQHQAQVVGQALETVKNHLSAHPGDLARRYHFTKPVN